MAMTNPFPEPESPALEPFTVYSAVEIAALLERMKAADAPITVYFDGGSAFSLTSLLAVQMPGTVVFDGVRDERQLLSAESLTFVGFVDQVKVQFTTEKAVAMPFDAQSTLLLLATAETKSGWPRTRSAGRSAGSGRPWT